MLKKMAAIILKSILIAIFTMYVFCDEIEMELRNGRVLKMLRGVVNGTKADSLNLPANATSIRENITDTFSCENRTYGYYADVDNECQIFHVCLQSQTPTGRNVTYKWSFICPAETVFNQEVLVCTRPRESIPCEESPNYYDLNLEIGKIATEEDKEDAKPAKDTENVTVKNQRRQPIRRKQNIIAHELIQEVFEQAQAMEEEAVQQELEETPEIVPGNAGLETQVMPEVDEFDGNDRLGMEKSLGRTGRNFRGSRRFKSDV